MFIDPLSPSSSSFYHRFKPRPGQKPLSGGFDELSISNNNDNYHHRHHHQHQHQRWTLRPPYFLGGGFYRPLRRPPIGYVTPFNHLNQFSRKDINHGSSKGITDDMSSESSSDPSDEFQT